MPWWAEFLLLAAIWGSSFMFMRLATSEFGAFATAGVRVTIASFFLLPLLIGRGLGRVLLQNWKRVFAVGVLNSALPFALFAYALHFITTGLSSILNATVPLFTALVAWGWLRDPLNASRGVGLTLGFVGVAWLAADKAGVKPGADEGMMGIAIAACLAATLCYGLAANFTKRYLSGLPSLVTATGSQIGASLALALPSALTWPTQTPSIGAWLALGVVGVVCTGVAYIFYFRLLDRVGPARSSAVTFLIPVFALLYGSVLLDEPLTLRMLMGGLVVVLGTALSTGVLKLPIGRH